MSRGHKREPAKKKEVSGGFTSLLSVTKEQTGESDGGERGETEVDRRGRDVLWCSDALLREWLLFIEGAE